MTSRRVVSLRSKLLRYCSNNYVNIVDVGGPVNGSFARQAINRYMRSPPTATGTTHIRLLSNHRGSCPYRLLEIPPEVPPKPTIAATNTLANTSPPSTESAASAGARPASLGSWLLSSWADNEYLQRVEIVNVVALVLKHRPKLLGRDTIQQSLAHGHSRCHRTVGERKRLRAVHQHYAPESPAEPAACSARRAAPSVLAHHPPHPTPHLGIGASLLNEVR